MRLEAWKCTIERVLNTVQCIIQDTHIMTGSPWHNDSKRRRLRGTLFRCNLNSERCTLNLHYRASGWLQLDASAAQHVMSCSDLYQVVYPNDGLVSCLYWAR